MANYAQRRSGTDNGGMSRSDMADIPLFEAYREYVGVDSVESLNASTLAVWACPDCDVRVPVVASDPQAYGPVLCPDCGELCETKTDNYA